MGKSRLVKKISSTERDRRDAKRLQSKGTHGDSVLAHVNPEEAKLLDYLADGLLDGGGRNVHTGLLSFGMADGESGGFGGSSGQDSNPGGVGGGPAGGQTGGGIGGNTSDGQGGLGGGYGDHGYAGSANQRRAQELGDYYRDTYINGMVDNPYSPKDTWMRVLEEYFTPSVPTNRYGPVTAKDMGIMGTVVGKLAGGPMSTMMGIGAAMGRAQSPAQQAASMSHNQAMGGINSTGQDRDSSTGLSSSEMAARSPSRSGLNTGKPASPASPSDPSVSVGQTPTTDPLMSSDPSIRSRLAGNIPDMIGNELYDYIWRGRKGGGLLEW